MPRVATAAVLAALMTATASADEGMCRVFSEAIEGLAESQHKTANFAEEEKESLMCIQHNDSRRHLETVKSIYERCMPYLRSLGTPESKQVIEVYDRAMADAESGMMELDAKMEAQCAERATCTGDAQTLKDLIEYNVHRAARARDEGNTTLACFTLDILKSPAEELSEYANECMVQDALDSVQKLRATMPHC